MHSFVKNPGIPIQVIFVTALLTKVIVYFIINTQILSTVSNKNLLSRIIYLINSYV